MMSPQNALHDPVFRAYFLIVLISLAAGGTVLAFLRFVWKKETASMLKTYWSWIFMAGIGLIIVFLGRIPTIVGVTLLAIYAFKEFARASGLYRDWWMTGAVYAGIITVGIASLISHPRGEEPGTGWYGFFVAVPVFAIALILIIPILRNLGQHERALACLEEALAMPVVADDPIKMHYILHNIANVHRSLIERQQQFMPSTPHPARTSRSQNNCRCTTCIVHNITSLLSESLRSEAQHRELMYRVPRARCETDSHQVTRSVTRARSIKR